MICQTLPKIIQPIIDNLPAIIISITDALLDNLPLLLSGIWALIKGIVAAIPSLLKALWEATKGALASTASHLKEWLSPVWNAIKEWFSSTWNSIKEWFSNLAQSVVDKVKNIFAKVKDAVLYPFKKAIEAVKDLFGGLKLSFPNIKLPHFAVSPKGWKIGDLLKGTIPKLEVEWYAKAMNNPMIMDEPTAFGVNARGQVMAGGEAGSEVVSGTNTLMNMISDAVAAQNDALVSYLQRLIQMLADYFPQILESMDRDFVFNDGTMAAYLAPAMDTELGRLKGRKDRGR